MSLIIAKCSQPEVCYVERGRALEASTVHTTAKTFCYIFSMTLQPGVETVWAAGATESLGSRRGPTQP